MDPTLAVSLVSALAVVGGLALAFVQIRDARQLQRSHAAQAFLTGIMDESFIRDHKLIRELPARMSREEWAKLSSDVQEAGFRIGMKCEGIGLLVHVRALPLGVVAEMMPIETYWRQLEPLVMELRESAKSEERGSWFQWLAERCAERAAKLEGPPHIRHKAWRP